MKLMKNPIRFQLIRVLKEYYPFILLLFSLAVKFLVYIKFGTEYITDEVIVTSISRQPLAELFQSVTAELHPVGFYLFLRLFDTKNVLFTRELITLISYTLVFLVLIDAYRSKIVDEFDLKPGIALFFTSYTFLQLTTYIKQETISFPLFLVLFFSALRLINNHVNFNNLLKIHLALLGLLLFGYYYYVISFIIVTLITIYLRNNRKVWLLYLIQIVIFVLNSFLIGFNQLTTNLSRFSYTTTMYNSIWRALSYHTNGVLWTGWTTDVATLVFVIPLIIVIVNYRNLSGKIRLIFLPTLLFLLALLIFSYPFKLYTISRYSIVQFFLLTILAGWGVIQWSRLFLPPVLVCLILISLKGFIINNTDFTRSRIRSYLIYNLESDKIYGFLDEHATAPFSITVNFPEIKNIVPLNLYFPDVFKDATTYGRKQLIAEGKDLVLSDADIKNRLEKTGMTSFLFRQRYYDAGGYFDPHRNIFRIMLTSCQVKDIYNISYTDILYVLDDCHFIDK